MSPDTTPGDVIAAVKSNRYKLIELPSQAPIGAATFQVTCTGHQIGFIRRFYSSRCHRFEFGYAFSTDTVPGDRFTGSFKDVNEAIDVLEKKACAVYDVLSVVEFQRK